MQSFCYVFKLFQTWFENKLTYGQKMEKLQIINIIFEENLKKQGNIFFKNNIIK